MTYTVAIVGSRDHWPDDAVFTAIEKLYRIHGELLRVVTGDAKGVDTVAWEQAALLGVPYDIEVAHWDTLGRREAGPERNSRVVAKADMLMAYFHPKPVERLTITSAGTVNAVLQARYKGIPVHARHKNGWLTESILNALGRPRPYTPKEGA